MEPEGRPFKEDRNLFRAPCQVPHWFPECRCCRSGGWYARVSGLKVSGLRVGLLKVDISRGLAWNLGRIWGRDAPPCCQDSFRAPDFGHFGMAFRVEGLVLGSRHVLQPTTLEIRPLNLERSKQTII